MIKATGMSTKDGTAVLVLGLSHRNLDRLREGEPIQFDGTVYGFDVKMVIFSMATEQDMEALIRGNSPGVVRIDERDAP